MTMPAYRSLDVGQHLGHALGGLDRHPLGFQNHEHQVAMTGEHGGIGNRQDWRGIDDDMVVLFTQVG